MKAFLKLVMVTCAAALVWLADIAPYPSQSRLVVQLTSEAHAVAGRARRTRRRGVAVGYQAGKSEAAAAEAEADAAKAEADSAKAEADAAKAELAVAQAPMAIGSVVEALPEGCTATVIDDVEYQYDGTNYYRAAFMGNELVYVTAQP